ncbi:MAG: hypothetical protein JXB00_00185 [Bacteroidales bacterium]|nr:hypothetical protein [Bacteroidales bacterium]
MKKRLSGIISILVIATILPLNAQVRQNGVVKKIQSRKIAFISERLKLTPEEEEKFWPVYNDFTNRKNLINQQRNSLLLYFEQNENNLSEKEVTETLQKIMAFQHQETELTDQYVNKFREFLPESKIVKVFVVEVQFRRWLLTQGVQSRQ